MKRKALVVLSGGQDSATCAAWAAHRFDDVSFVTFDYGQRHRSKEIQAAVEIADLFGAPTQVHKVPSLVMLGSSGLTNSKLDVSETDQVTKLPRSFVPGRNLVFLTQAAAIALDKGILDVVTGVCQTDYSGYPDCRRTTIDALVSAIRQGTDPIGKQFQIHTPLMFLTKAQTVQLARELPNGWDAVARSWTCYEGGEKPCGRCPACTLRAKGFNEAGEVDPALAVG